LKGGDLMLEKVKDLIFEKIKKDINKRMSQYNDSRHPTSDEVTIAWLVLEIERLKQNKGGE